MINIYHQKSITSKFITIFLAFILALNNFMLNSKFSKINDCAMGTKCTTSYGIILMAELGEKYTYPLIKAKLIIY